MKRRLISLIVICLLVSSCGRQKTATQPPVPNGNNANTTQPIPSQQDRLQLVATQIDRAAVGLDAAIEVKRALLKDNIITQAQSAALTPKILVVIRLVRELKDTLMTVDSIEAGRPQLLVIFKRIRESFTNLTSAGIIPSGQATDKIGRAFEVTRIAIDALGPLLGV